MSKPLSRTATARAVAAVAPHIIPPAPAPEPKPASEVSAQYMLLGNAIEALEYSIRHLGERLDPALNDLSSTEDGHAGVAEPTPSSPLGRSLMEFRHRVAALTLYVDGRLHRDLAL